MTSTERRGSNESWLVTLAFGGIGIGVLWLVLTWAMPDALTAVHSLDERLLGLVHAPGAETPPGPIVLQEAVRDITALGGFTVVGGLLAVVTGYLLLTGRPRQAFVLITTIGTGIAVTMLLKMGIDRARPDLVVHAAHVASAAFPSAHASTSAVAYLTLAAMLAQTLRSTPLRVYVLSVAILVTLVVGISRIYLGVHWPTDVVAGWLFGAGWAAAGWILERRLRERGLVASGADSNATSRRPSA